jgi:hypothetical protein
VINPTNTPLVNTRMTASCSTDTPSFAERLNAIMLRQPDTDEYPVLYRENQYKATKLLRTEVDAAIESLRVRVKPLDDATFVASDAAMAEIMDLSAQLLQLADVALMASEYTAKLREESLEFNRQRRGGKDAMIQMFIAQHKAANQEAIVNE